MIKTIIFDMGNVLVFFDHRLMVEQIASVCGLPFSDVFEDVITKGVGIQYEKGLITTEQLYDFFKIRAKERVEDQQLYEAIGDIFQMNEPMLGLVRKLKEKGFRLFLLSNTCEIHIETIRAKYQVIHEFEAQVLSFEVKARKPDPEIYLAALDLSGNKPEECLYIDDIKEYVDAAEQLGMQGEHFEGYEQLVTNLHKRQIL